MALKTRLPIKKSKEDIAFYIENGPKFGNILYSLYQRIRSRELIYPHKVIKAFEEACQETFLDFPIRFPFPQQVNSYDDTFDRSVCISVNDVAAHGKATEMFQEGDVISIDCGLALNTNPLNTLNIDINRLKYLHFDAAFTVEIGSKQNWVRAPWSALGMILVEQPKNVYELGTVIEKMCELNNLSNVISLTGHGIGYDLHELPYIHNAKGDYAREELFEGLCFCAEPIFAKKKNNNKLIERTCIDSDGWCIRTQSGDPTSHFETMYCKHEGQIIDLLGVTKWAL